MHGLHASCHPPVKPGGSSQVTSHGLGASGSSPRGGGKKKKKMIFSLQFFRQNGDAAGKAVLEVRRGGSREKLSAQEPQAELKDDVDRSGGHASYVPTHTPPPPNTHWSGRTISSAPCTGPIGPTH